MVSRLRLTAALLICVTSPSASQPGKQAESLPSLLPYAGSYVTPAGHELAVSVRNTPMGAMLVLYDLRTDAVRALFQTVTDSFIAGPELTRSAPPQFHATFLRNGQGTITGLQLTGDRYGSGVRAARRSLTTVPFDVRRDDVDLRGTLHLPPDRPRGVLVLAHGSEDADRYSFDVLPVVLANHGFAVLAYDRRGTGASTGSWQAAGIDDLADDVIAGITALKVRPDLRGLRIGIVGVSEGGWVAPLAAAREPDVSFIVAISGGSVTKGETFIYKDRRRAEEQGLSGAALDSVVRQSESTIAASRARVQGNGPASGFDRRVTYDPTQDWQRFKGPILSLGGEFDVLEDATRSAERLAAILAEVDHTDFTIKVFPKTHHMLFLGTTGQPSEFSGMRGVRQMAPGYWDVLLRWLERRLSPT